MQLLGFLLISAANARRLDRDRRSFARTDAGRDANSKIIGRAGPREIYGRVIGKNGVFSRSVGERAGGNARRRREDQSLLCVGMIRRNYQWKSSVLGGH